MKTVFLLSSILFANVSIASSWEGPGIAYEATSDVTSEYDVKVELSSNEQGQQLKDVTVTPKDGGAATKVHCVTSYNAESWKSVCDHGQASGQMFANNLGVDYLTTDTGESYSTNIVMDSPTQMRLFRIKLVDGKAVRFYSEKLTKK